MMKLIDSKLIFMFVLAGAWIIYAYWHGFEYVAFLLSLLMCSLLFFYRSSFVVKVRKIWVIFTFILLILFLLLVAILGKDISGVQSVSLSVKHELFVFVILTLIFFLTILNSLPVHKKGRE